MTEEALRLALAASCLEGVGRKKVIDILRRYGIADLSADRVRESLRQPCSDSEWGEALTAADGILAACDQHHITPILYSSAEYPPQLTVSTDPPE